LLHLRPALPKCPFTRALGSVRDVEPDPFTAAIIAGLEASGTHHRACVEVELRPDAAWRPKGSDGPWFDVFAPPPPGAVRAAVEAAPGGAGAFSDSGSGSDSEGPAPGGGHGGSGGCGGPPKRRRTASSGGGCMAVQAAAADPDVIVIDD
jgi:hypothetical protein